MGVFTRILDPETKEEFQVKFGDDTGELHSLGDRLWDVGDDLYWSWDNKRVVVVKGDTIVAVLPVPLDDLPDDDVVDRVNFTTDLLRELFWPGSVDWMFKWWVKAQEAPLWKRIWWKVSRLFWWRRKKELERFRLWALPLVRKQWPKLTIDQIVSVQSMTAETEMDVEVRRATQEEMERSSRAMQQGNAIERFVKVMGSEFKFDFPYTIPCPCCGGKLVFSKSSWNGHRNVECATEGCGTWME